MTSKTKSCELFVPHTPPFPPHVIISTLPSSFRFPLLHHFPSRTEARNLSRVTSQRPYGPLVQVVETNMLLDTSHYQPVWSRTRTDRDEASILSPLRAAVHPQQWIKVVTHDIGKVDESMISPVFVFSATASSNPRTAAQPQESQPIFVFREPELFCRVRECATIASTVVDRRSIGLLDLSAGV